MASISGGEIRVFLSTDSGSTYKAFAFESDCSFELTADTREITSKDDAVFRSYVTSAKAWTITGSAIYGDDDASEWNPDEIYAELGEQRRRSDHSGGRWWRGSSCRRKQD